MRKCNSGLFAIFAIVVGLVLSVWTAAPAVADGNKDTSVTPSRDWLGGIPEAPTEDWAVAFGGRLYDDWALAVDVPQMDVSHASYPSSSKKKGHSTWRCKECHGWDYSGNLGVYSKGSHRTGIKGIRNLVGKNPTIVENVIRDKNHGYTTEQISVASGRRLALFVTRGQHDIARFVNMNTSKALGDAGLGEGIFQNVCAACHGFDGRAINFKTEDNPEFIGTVANAAPWEALHKIRNGLQACQCRRSGSCPYKPWSIFWLTPRPCAKIDKSQDPARLLLTALPGLICKGHLFMQ